jgi:glycosyltransferase involved in cell wall biosynthesis
MLSYMSRAWWLGRKLPQLITEVGKPDAIIGSSVHLLAVLAAYGVAKHHGARFVMEVRDLWPQTIIDMGELSAGSPVTKILQALEQFLYREAERIITLLPRAGEYISAQEIGEDKIVWIPNGVDLSRFDNIELMGRSHGEFNVMYLGAHGRANALDVPLQAAKLVQDRGFSNSRFILIGDGPEKPHLIELAQELELRNVEFRDPVQKTNVSQTLQEADVLLFNLEEVTTFRYGISSNKLFDYMAAKKPVIFSVKTSNNPVEEAHCGFTVPPRDPAALAEAVIELYRMPKEARQTMGHRGRAFVEKHHSIPVLAERLLRCLQDNESGINQGVLNC